METCSFFIYKTRLKCTSPVVVGADRCSEHWGGVPKGADSDLVPCPLDPSHKVSSFRLKQHLKQCPEGLRAGRRGARGGGGVLPTVGP